MLSYFTAGESHGSYLITVVEGFPRGVPINVGAIQEALKRRRACAGRGPRSRKEKDTIQVISGICPSRDGGYHKGKTIGSPITILIPNRVSDIDSRVPLWQARPGHIDLAAARKFKTSDVRDITERASARETAARVTAGALAQILLAQFNIKIIGYTTNIGGINIPQHDIPTAYAQLSRQRKHSAFYAPVAGWDNRFRNLLDEVTDRGDTVGGAFEVRAINVPVGLGDHTQWDRRLDGRLGQALMSIPAVKGVEIGLGFGYADVMGSEAQDGIIFRQVRPVLHRMVATNDSLSEGKGKSLVNQGGGFARSTNHAGGIEGGITNGEDILLRAVVKPIPTLKRPLVGVNLRTGRSCRALVESADICAVPAAAVIGESVVAFEMACAFLERFGGVTFTELKQHFALYQKELNTKSPPE